MDQNTNNVPQQGGKGLSIASMVLGIVSIVLSFCVPYLPIVLGIVAVVLGGIALVKKMPGKGMAITGLVTGVIAIAIYIIAAIIVGAALSSINSLL